VFQQQIMHQSNIAMKGLGLAAFVSTAQALVTIPRNEAFSVDAIAAPASQFDPASELERLLFKFPTTSSSRRRQANDAEQQASATVQPSESGLSYLVPTVVGNQTFQMIYDTGSADLWVYSNESSIYQSLDHPTYIPTSSATLLPNYTWAIKYASGANVEGVVFTDIVKAGPVVAKKQAVQSATIIPYEFSSDGILGLASSSINTVQPEKQNTFFDTVAPTLPREVFAANLRRDGNGTWDFGYIDDTKYTGDIAWAPSGSDQKHWTINVQEYATGEGPFGKTTVGDVIVDSGASLVYLPDTVVADYYSQIDGYTLEQGGGHTFPCNSTVPDFHFKVGEAVLTIPGRDVNYATYDPTKNMCVGAITGQLNMRYSVLGNLFMRNYYVVHSREEDTPKMGFALQK
jgi:aspergillopepsin I